MADSLGDSFGEMMMGLMQQQPHVYGSYMPEAQAAAGYPPPANAADPGPAYYGRNHTGMSPMMDPRLNQPPYGEPPPGFQGMPPIDDRPGGLPPNFGSPPGGLPPGFQGMPPIQDPRTQGQMVDPRSLVGRAGQGIDPRSFGGMPPDRRYQPPPNMPRGTWLRMFQR
jgi:hypothetical protein